MHLLTRPICSRPVYRLSCAWRAYQRFEVHRAMSTHPKRNPPKDSRLSRWKSKPVAGFARIGTEDIQLLVPKTDTGAARPVDPSYEQRPLLSVFDEMERVSALKLSGSLTTEIERRLIETPAPSLQHFALYGTLPSAGSRFDANMPVLFRGHHPKLTSLAVGFFTQFGDNRFANLKSLHLFRQIFISDRMLSLAILLNSSPGLEDLRFSKVAFTDDSSSTGATLPTVFLPRLRTLALDCVSMGYATRLMRCIRIDEAQPLALTIEAFGVGMDGITQEPLHRLGEFFDLNPYGIIDRMTQLTVSMTPQVNRPQDECSLVFTGPEQSVSFLRYAMPTCHELSKILRRSMASLPIKDLWIECPEVRSADDVRSESVRDLLSVAQGIRRLYIDVDAPNVPKIWPVLADSCSSLEELHINLPRLPADTENIDVAYAWYLLKGALQTRAARRWPRISRLHLYSPDYRAVDVDAQILSLHEAWQTQIQEQGLPHTSEVTLHPVAHTGAQAYALFPKMGLPPVHKTPSDGLWRGADLE